MVACALVACGPESSRTPVDGAESYAVRCGYCHDAPGSVGTALTPRLLASYGTAGALGRYLRVAMPHEAPGSLEAAEYDAILTYLTRSRGLLADSLFDGVAGTPPDSAALRVSP